MLLEKQKSVNDVVTLKLSSGEEVIARYESETPDGIKVSKPMVLSMTQQGVGMMPYLFTVNPNVPITFKNNSVSVLAVTDKDFADQYLESTTGIKLA